MQREKKKSLSTPEPLLSGTSCMQMDASDSQFHTISKAPLKRRNMNKKESKSKSPLSTSCCLWCFIPTWQGAMLLGLGTGKASLYLPISFSLYSFSLSQLSLNWGQGPLGLALLCHRKIANPGSTLIEHWKQEFYKEADLLFITSHSLLFFLPLSSVFFSSTGSWCHTPASFRGLFSSSLYAVFILSFSAVTPSPLGVSHGEARI